MRFLRVLRLRLVLAGLVGDIARVEAVRDGETRGADRARIHLHTVGTHVGDRAVLVEALRDPHRVIRRETEFPRGLLLERRRRERRRRVAPGGLGLDRLDREIAVEHRLLGAQRIAFVADREAIELGALELRQPRGERGAVMLHIGRDGPIFLRLEDVDLALALDDQAERHRLDAAGGLGTGQLAPQHRREREADEVIERAAGAIGVDQIVVELARVLHRLGHRRLGDRVEGDALDLLGERLARAQHFADVPRDRLALAIRIGREDQAVGELGEIGDRLQLLRLVRVILPRHRERIVGIDRAVLGRQVADMAVAGQDAVIAAQILLDGFGLGGRFDDDKLHGETGVLTCTRTRVTASGWPRQPGVDPE